MDEVTSNGLRYRAKNQNRDMVPQTDTQASGAEALELQNLRDGVHKHLHDGVVPSGERNGYISQDDHETNIDNGEEADDTERLLSTCDEDVEVLDDEGSFYDINALIQSVQGEESSLSIISQVSLPFLIAGYGMVAAGMVLDIVQHWDVFTNVKEIFILVPALLGLKGNLEMTLASRLSTQANLGNMESRKEVLKMVGGNMALIQAQAIVVGFLSSVTAMVFGWIPKGEFNFSHALLLCASSLFTAAVASFALGFIMVVVVLLSRYFKINPDNVATPIAASLGDLVTLALLAWVANTLFIAIEKQHWLAPVIIAFFMLLLPLWVVICINNKYTDDVIYSGWTPVLSAMIISSIGGLILDYAVSSYDGIAVFQPIINGVGGNLVAVHASRISTSLHMKGKPGSHIKDDKLRGCLNIFKVFFGCGVHSRAARVLVLLAIPGHLLFSYTVFYMGAGHTSSTLMFQVFYLSAAVLQVILLLYIATWLVPLIWVRGSDPDNVAIPYLTAFGDLLGTAFLAVAFHLLYLVGDKDADVGE
ncbi:unnamed protein product [Candidula unifasciata]|uniref:SLC41A/MgtE integral membrane domain-containing protein n=1 Tax=Candidula unifasciata TaxID=100452 RepID=A0A8S3YZJ0_9EUPU|nr:unnamed protein product [Candidula unifasciata]